ncbi:MAG: beta-lactamase family protein, partial [Desulfobacterales bacterium]
MSMNPVEKLMRQGVAENVFPGAVLLVSQGNVVVHHKAYGRANIFSGRVMTTDTIFDLASLTKPLATSLAIMKLVQ